MATVIQAIVSMNPTTSLTITNPLNLTPNQITASPMDVASCNVTVPVCRGIEDFNNGNFLRIGFTVNGQNVPIVIYEQNSFMRFTVMMSPPPPTGTLMLPNGTPLGFPSDYVSAGFNAAQLARPLANSKSGGDFFEWNNPNAILVLDERFWLILYAIAQPPAQ